jgi:RimJ/RimL family protein N-acetyltransferase
MSPQALAIALLRRLVHNLLTTVMLKEDQWKRLAKIRLMALESDRESFLATHEKESAYNEFRWREEFLRGKWIIVADQDDDIALLGVTKEKDTPQCECYLEFMWVTKERRRQHIATDILHEVLNALRQSGIITVWLWVLEGNARAADLYKRIGFSFTGKSQPLPNNPSRNEEQMKLTFS